MAKKRKHKKRATTKRKPAKRKAAKRRKPAKRKATRKRKPAKRKTAKRRRKKTMGKGHMKWGLVHAHKRRVAGKPRKRRKASHKKGSLLGLALGAALTVAALA